MLAKMFEQLVPTFDDKVAVQTEDGSLTYGQLNRYANQVGHEILANCRVNHQNGGPTTVGLLFEHGIGMIVGLVGALKTGHIYVPLDPTYPEKRLAYMMENSGASLIVTNTHHYQLARQIAIGADGTELPIVCIDQIPAETPDTNLQVEIPEDAVAYILYTSGSTGRPKGVYQNHRNIWHFIKGYTDDLSITSNDRLTLLSAFCHDAAVMDIYSGLLNGATLYPVSIKTKSMDTMAEWLIREKITIWHSVPTVYRFLIHTLTGEEVFPHLRLVVLGGEAVLANDVLMFKRFFPEAVFMNLYGQSESSYNSGQFISAATPFSKVMLGKPVQGTEILVINESGKKALPLQVGEIVIASPHVACGYWQNPEKTAEVFRDHPTRGRLYRTGDLGKLLVDGNIEFMGRKDFQVKIRGYRIEPGEIESQLLEYPGVTECVVIAKKESEENYTLCAFVVARENVMETELRTYLGGQLPEYMIPAYFVKLDRLPLTPNNKVDRLALMEMNPEVAGTMEYEAPTNDTEERLVKIWEDVLHRERIGIQDNFFQIGGHSLKATQLVARVYREFQVEVPLREIFQNASTIKEMANYLHSARESIYTAIEPVAEQAYYPLSSAQRRLFILCQIETMGTTYNMPSAFTIEGELDVERLTGAFQQLVQRHEALRTSFTFVNGEPVQEIQRDLVLPIERIDAREEEVEALVRKFIQPFDLQVAPLIRARLIRVAADRHILIYDMHHIISDGSSKVLLAQELGTLYQGANLPPLRVQYKDFAVWQNELFRSETIKEQENFWTNLFSGEIPVLNLPTDNPRPAITTFEGDQVKFSMGNELSAKFKSFLQRQGVTLYMGLLAAYSVLLAKYSGQEDIVIGSPIAGRPHVDLERMVGMFVNTLALRSQPVMDKSFDRYLQEIKELSLKAYENQDYPFEMLVEKVGVKRDLSRNPLFDVLFTLQNMDRKEILLDKIRFIAFDYTASTARFDLSLTAFEVEERIELFFEYRTQLFTRATIERMVEHLLYLLEEIAAGPEKRLAELQILGREERQRLLDDYNNTHRELPANQVYQQAFEAQAAERPDAIALVAEGRSMTYRELNERANSLAHHLRKLGVGRETVVGLMAHRTMRMLVGLLAIIKAGGAYLPIDPEYPSGRTQYMLSDSGAQVLLTEKRLAGPQIISGGIDDIFGEPAEPMLSFPFAGEVVFLDSETLYQGETANPLLLNEPQDMLYLIYTSGSTGQPKGTVLEHRSVLNFITGICDQIDFQPEQATLSLTTISFDIFLLETLLPLTCGGTVVLGTEDEQKDPRLAAQRMREQAVEIAQLTPSRLQIFLEDQAASAALGTLRAICVGGEAFPETLLHRLQETTKAKIYNMYGPTETTVWSTMSDLTEARTVNIGSPIANTRIYILDAALELVPEKVVGELYIAGLGLARGYYQRPELTAERFIADPFVPGERMYRTGDLARWLPGGRIEYIGRKDQQVKIRGYRIEVGEIEALLDQYPGIRGSAVVAREASGGFKYLAAYYAADAEIPVPEWRNYLLQHIPEYMVPGYYIRLDTLPLTPNGKVDRRALPDVEEARPTLLEEYVAPETETEKAIAGIWQEMLQVERVGLHDNFFDLGGNSLLLVQMHSKLEAIFPGRVAVVDLFAYPTVARLTHFIETRRDTAEEAAKAQAYWENELRQPYTLLTLPAAYYETLPGDGGMDYQFRLTGVQAQMLRQIAQDLSVEVEEILIALYLYLFAEITGESDIIIETDLTAPRFPLRVQFAEIDDLSQLFQIVHEKCRHVQRLTGYSIPSIRGGAREEHVIPLISRELGRKQENAIGLKVSREEEAIAFECRYDETRLSGDAMEGLIKGYLTLIEMLTQEYAHGTEQVYDKEDGRC